MLIAKANTKGTENGVTKMNHTEHDAMKQLERDTIGGRKWQVQMNTEDG